MLAFSNHRKISSLTRSLALKFERATQSPRKLVKTDYEATLPEFLMQKVWGGTRGLKELTNSQATLMRPTGGPRFENNRATCPKCKGILPPSG